MHFLKCVHDVLFIKPPLATARAASCDWHICLSVCLFVAKLQKEDFRKN